MKSSKLVALVASAALSIGALTPSLIANAENLHKVDNNNVKTQQTTNSIKRVSTSKNNTNTTSTPIESANVEQVNIVTGKVIKTTDSQKKEAVEEFKANSNESSNSSFAVTFHGYWNEAQYNGDNIHQLKNGTSFASPTNEALYNQMLNSNNRWNAEKEAISLHGGSGANDCAYFLSSALRQIGIGIPTSTANCWTLQDNLSNLGWQRHYDLSGMQPGDVAFAGDDGDAHTYIFMGWANNQHTVAWVADSQYGWFGTNMHVRGTTGPSIDNNISPTVFYYTAPGGSTSSNANPNGNANPNYAPYGVGTVTASSLNVRTSPDTNSQVIGQVYSGDLVQILSKSNNWDEINYNGRTAYVYAPYVNGNGPAHPNNITITGNSTVTNPTPSKPKAPVIPSITQENKQGVLTGNSNIILFAGPSDTTKQVVTIKPNQKVAVTGVGGLWSRVVCSGGAVGWLPTSDINFYNPSSTVLGSCFAFTPNQDEYIFSSPSNNSNHIATFSNGQNCIAVANSNGWTQVVSGNTIGWIPTNFLVSTGSNSSLPTMYTNNGSVSVNGNTLPENTEVTIVNTSGSKTQILVNNELSWVPTSDLSSSVTKPTPVVKPVTRPTPIVKPVTKPTPVVKPKVVTPTGHIKYTEVSTTGTELGSGTISGKVGSEDGVSNIAVPNGYKLYYYIINGNKAYTVPTYMPDGTVNIKIVYKKIEPKVVPSTPKTINKPTPPSTTPNNTDKPTTPNSTTKPTTPSTTHSTTHKDSSKSTTPSTNEGNLNKPTPPSTTPSKVNNPSSTGSNTTKPDMPDTSSNHTTTKPVTKTKASPNTVTGGTSKSDKISGQDIPTTHSSKVSDNKSGVDIPSTSNTYDLTKSQVSSKGNLDTETGSSKVVNTNTTTGTGNVSGNSSVSNNNETSGVSSNNNPEVNGNPKTGDNSELPYGIIAGMSMVGLLLVKKVKLPKLVIKQ